MANYGNHPRNTTAAGSGRRRSRGFTLLELMIVVIVIAILTILAVSSYQFANVKARRNAAKGCLTQAAQFMERYYTTNMKYTSAPSPTTVCDSSITKYYTVSFSGTPDETTYTVQAVPTTSQKDGKCGTLSLNQAGTKTPTTDGCW